MAEADARSWNNFISLVKDVCTKCGPGHWERVYKEAIYLAAIKGKFCCQMEQALYVPQKSGRCYAEHRVDLVIGGRFVFELKTTKPSQIEQKKNCSQIWNYLDFMRSANHVITRAAIIYFTSKGVYVVEVQADGKLAHGFWLVLWAKLAWRGGKELVVGSVGRAGFDHN